MLLAFANLPQPGLVPPATSREGRRPGRQSSATPWLKEIASSHCSFMTSKGNSRANGISERESNNQPDCEDDHGIGHAFTEFPRQSLVVGQPKAALRNEDTAKTRVSALPALPPNSELPLRETSSWRSASARETRSSPSSLQSRQPQKNTATARRFQLFGPVSPGVIRLDP
jgi:hypothetical protein